MSLHLVLVDYRRRDAGIIGTVRALEDDRLVFTDGVNLSTARGRGQFYDGLAQQLNGTCPDRRTVEADLLVLLQDAEAQLAQEAAERANQDAGADDEESVPGPYRATDRGLLWLKPTRDGDVPIPLTNFNARIVEDVAHDDGSGDLRRVYALAATLGSRHTRFTVPAAQFAALSWALEHLGAEAIVYPGLSARDHARVAIQELSGSIPRRTVFAHTGWRKLDGVWVYLHAGGAVGPVGPGGPVFPTVEVQLDAPLDRLCLPGVPAGAARTSAVAALLEVLAVAPDRLTVPLLGGVLRAAVGGVDFALHLAGPTGVQKSELAALAQQCFGPTLDARHLPGSWSSTGNALEGMAFVLKDCVCVIDDFAPTGSQTDVARLHREADRLLRAQGNLSGRARMRADTTLRPARPPRGMILSTGEDIPRGQSLRSRLVVLEVAPGDVRLDRLTVCQQQAADGLFAKSLAGFIQWLATHYEEVHQRLPAWEREQRQRALASGLHRRTPDNVAKLAAGWMLFLSFAVECAVLTETAAAALWQRVWTALGAAAAAQAQHQSAGEPASRFLDLLRGALVAGLAHVADMANQAPEDYRVWGWEARAFGDDGISHLPRGQRIGWLDGAQLYLEPEASFAVAQRLAASQNEALAISKTTLHKRLRERGLLQSVDAPRDRLVVRRVIDGHRHAVLHLAAAALLPPEPAQPAHSAHSDAETASAGVEEDGYGPVPWAGFFAVPGKPAHASPPEPAQDTPADVQPESDGSDGPVGPVSAAREDPACADTAAESPIGADAAPTVTLVSTAEELVAALPALQATELLGLDCETTGLDPLSDRLRLIQLATPEQVVVIDCFAVNPTLLAPVFASAHLVGHNLLFDLRFLLAAGLPVPDGDRLFDTMLASQLLHSGLPEPKGTHTLAALVERTLGLTLDKTLQTSDWGGVLTDDQIAYAARDAAVLSPLAQRLMEQLDAAELQEAAALEMRALPAVVWLSHSGAPVDQERWLSLADGAVLEQHRLEDDLTRVAGTGDLFGRSAVHWSSPAQVASLLQQRGHTLTSTDETTLQALGESEPLAPLLLAYREAGRKASAYGIEFLRHVHPATDRIHPAYRQIGAATGRMACGAPNLQNIPRDPAYRACFHPGPGRCLVKADYSQIELRIAAQISGDPALLAAFQDGVDLHRRTAASLLGVAEDAVTGEQRQLAKACAFGLLYGMGAERLQQYAADGYGVTLSRAEAERVRDRFFQTYTGLRRWQQHQPQQPTDTRTLAGRRRLGVTSFTEKLNSPIQGTGADLLKLALARLWEDRAAQPSAVPVLCVHDEIVLECDATDAEAVVAWLVGHMEAAGRELLPDVPVVAEVSIAADWSGTPLEKEIVDEPA